MERAGAATMSDRDEREEDRTRDEREDRGGRYDDERDDENERFRERRDDNESNDREGRERKTVKRGSGELCPQSLLVRNVSYRVTTGEIRNMMEKYGEVRDVYIPLDHHTGRSRGFAFVEFYDERDAR